MTPQKNIEENETCPAQGLLKLLSGKWKPEIFRLAVDGPVRFSTLMRLLNGANKQSLSVALRELEEVGLLEKVVLREKPLHIAYYLSKEGIRLVPVFLELEQLS